MEKPKHQSLVDFLANIPKNTVVDIPMSSITKEERLLLEGDSPRERYFNAFKHSSPRDLVIQLVSAIEDSFSKLLKNYTVEKIGEQLFKRRGDVKDFGLRINLAYALGLISEAEAKSARSLSQIRNAFAHDPDLFDFHHDEKVVSKIKELRPEESDVPLRFRFFLAALDLIGPLEKRANEILSKRCIERTNRNAHTSSSISFRATHELPIIFVTR